MRFRSLLVGLTVAATLTASAAFAADEVQITLDQAIKATVENNLGVQLQSYDYRITGESAIAQYGLLDWNSFATLSTSKTEQASVDVTQSSSSEVQLANLGVNHLLSTGGTFGLTYNNSRNNENAAAYTQPSFYSTGLGAAFTQPLLRNFGVDITRRGINIARNNLGISREAFRTLLLDTVYTVEQAYYDVVYTRGNLDVQNQSLALAKEQERITQIRIDVGADAPLDILEPQVSIAQREQDVIIAEAALRNAEDNLRQLMNLPAEKWGEPFVPQASLDYAPVEINLDEAVAKAFAARPEIRQAKLTQENQAILRSYSHNQVLPQLDLDLRYRYSGIDTTYNDAFSQVSGADYPGWQVQLQFGLPISNTEARANARQAELEFERATTSEAQTRQQIMVEVRGAARDIDTALKGIVATKAAREAAEKNLDAQRKRFDNGMSTNFDVLRVQNDLANARSREILALTGYQKSVARYHRAIGDLLELRGIDMQEPAQFDLPESRLENVGWLNYGSKGDTAPKAGDAKPAEQK